MHKPFGYLSQFVCEHDWKKVLGELYSFPEGTMPVGRLDEHSEGLLLLTTNGILCDQMRSKDKEKEYYAQVDGLIDEASMEKMRKGVEIGIRSEKYITLPCKVRLLTEMPDFPPRIKKIRDDRHGPTCWVSIILTEGKYRQIRKMTAAVGFPTLRLIRVRVDQVWLGNLKQGEVKEVPAFI
ncbi:MAG: pseudouridine synthase [Lentimicrobium sp.]|jgi:23S rRNA pseudouridine2457 synthase|nr:pseudouridine synthase [Lentimicrobium sp.]